MKPIARQKLQNETDPKTLESCFFFFPPYPILTGYFKSQLWFLGVFRCRSLFLCELGITFYCGCVVGFPWFIFLFFFTSLTSVVFKPRHSSLQTSTILLRDRVSIFPENLHGIPGRPHPVTSQFLRLGQVRSHLRSPAYGVRP